MKRQRASPPVPPMRTSNADREHPLLSLPLAIVATNAATSLP